MKAVASGADQMPRFARRPGTRQIARIVPTSARAVPRADSFLVELVPLFGPELVREPDVYFDQEFHGRR